MLFALPLDIDSLEDELDSFAVTKSDSWDISILNELKFRLTPLDISILKKVFEHIEFLVSSQLESDMEIDNIEERNLYIQIKNLNDAYTAQLSSSSVSVVVSGSENIINNLNENSISCYVDATSLKEGEQTAGVVVSIPEGVSLVSQDIQNVKLQVNKKTSEEQNANSN